MIINNYCDECGEKLENDFTYPMIKSRYEDLIFCCDDCKEKFIDSITFDVYIDINGVIIED